MNEKEYKERLDYVAEIFKALSHPTRLCMVCKLMVNELNVSQMQDCLVMPQSTVSQHLSVLRNKGIIEGNRNGSEVIYSLVDDNVREIISVYFSKEQISN